MVDEEFENKKIQNEDNMNKKSMIIQWKVRKKTWRMQKI